MKIFNIYQEKNSVLAITIMLLFFLFTLFCQIRNTDIGVVAYFQQGCPQGWQLYLPAKGRFFLSANQIYSSGSTGGTANKTLTVDNLPSHTHSITADGRHGQTAQYATDIYSSWGDIHHQARTKVSSATGNNQPFSIIPPYIALISCKKVNATLVNCSQVTTACDLPRFLNIQSSLTQESRKIFQLEKSIQKQQLIINELSRYNITNSNSLQTTLNRVESLSNKQTDSDNRAELGLSITAVILSALALIIQCYRLLKR